MLPLSLSVLFPLCLISSQSPVSLCPCFSLSLSASLSLVRARVCSTALSASLSFLLSLTLSPGLSRSLSVHCVSVILSFFLCRSLSFSVSVILSFFLSLFCVCSNSHSSCPLRLARAISSPVVCRVWRNQTHDISSLGNRSQKPCVTHAILQQSDCSVRARGLSPLSPPHPTP